MFRAAAFQRGQQLRGALEHVGRQPGHRRDLHAPGAIRRAGRDAVQEAQPALAVLLGGDRRVGDPLDRAGQRGQLLEMGREERARPALAGGQPLGHGLGDRQPVPGAGAAPDLVQQHQRALARAVQQAGRLEHLDQEGRAPRGQVVLRADAGEDAVHDADPGPLGGHEAAGLGEDHDQRGLAQVGALARHVGPGQQQQLGRARAVGGQRRVVGHEGRRIPRRTQRGLHDRMPPGRDLQARLGLQLGPAPVALGGQIGQPGRRVEPRQRARAGADPSRLRGQRGGQRLDPAALGLDQLLLGRLDFVGQRAQARLGEALRAAQALAPLPAVRHRVQPPPRHLQVIAPGAVIAQLQPGDARLFAQRVLQRREPLQRRAAPRRGRVERGVHAGPQHAAAVIGFRSVDQRRGQRPRGLGRGRHSLRQRGQRGPA